MKPTHAMLALLIAAIPAESPAQTTSDAACLLVSNVFAKSSKDAGQKERAQNVLFYYFGRMAVRLNQSQMTAEFKQSGVTKLTPESATALMNSCAGAMQSNVQVLQKALQQVQAAK